MIFEICLLFLFFVLNETDGQLLETFLMPEKPIEIPLCGGKILIDAEKIFFIGEKKEGTIRFLSRQRFSLPSGLLSRNYQSEVGILSD